MKRYIVPRGKKFTKDWRTELDAFSKRNIDGGTWDFKLEDFVPSQSMENVFTELRVLDIKQYDPIINSKNLQQSYAYEFNEANLNKIAEDKKLQRKDRLSPELNINHLPMIDNKFMLIQDNTYRVYFDFIQPLDKNDGFVYPEGKAFDIVPTAKALNYGFIIQSPVVIEINYNPVIPFYDDVLGYILSTNLYTPVTVNIPMGSLIAHGKIIQKYLYK